MTFKNDGRIRKGQWTVVRRMLRIHELGRKLDEYEGFVRYKANKLAWTYDDRKDLEQVGREAVAKVFGVHPTLGCTPTPCSHSQHMIVESLQHSGIFRIQKGACGAGLC